ncbi:MAG TPA: superoxide dismutase [Verrucomicrobiae bacterium]|nr:superoxide dismutase [Verrucomicrobiae bacterium]
MMTRRDALKKAAMATVACATTTAFNTAKADLVSPPMTFATTKGGPFWQAQLPYAYDALEPHIDAETMQLHHDNHHASYVANLNKILTEPKLVSWPVDRILRNLNAVPENVRSAVRYYGGGHYNHSIFWKMMKKNGGGEPKSSLANAIELKYTSFSAFKDVFTQAAMGQFGSGWTWLTSDGKDLRIEITDNQDNPISQGRIPLIGIDMWEHAYYLKYQNKRADYIAAWFNVVNWEYASERFVDAERMV